MTPEITAHAATSVRWDLGGVCVMTMSGNPSAQNSTQTQQSSQ